jgi:hypothetical protein
MFDSMLMYFGSHKPFGHLDFTINFMLLDRGEKEREKGLRSVTIRVRNNQIMRQQQAAWNINVMLSQEAWEMPTSWLLRLGCRLPTCHNLHQLLHSEVSERRGL